MKTFLVLLLCLVLVAGCAASGTASYTVTVFSGGKEIRKYEANFLITSHGYASFNDVETNRRVTVFGDVVIEAK